MKKKQILLINDLAGYGKVATAAMLPILSYNVRKANEERYENLVNEEEKFKLTQKVLDEDHEIYVNDIKYDGGTCSEDLIINPFIKIDQTTRNTLMCSDLKGIADSQLTF